jgi:ABC-type spermidine/putrescine transport system permease subunit I
MVVFFLYPLSGVAWQSVTTIDGQWTLSGYQQLAASKVFPRVLWNTFETAFIAMSATLVVAYPIAYYLSKCPPRKRALLMMLVLVPFWTSILVKSFAFMILLGNSGIVNSVLRLIPGVTGLPLLYNKLGVILGLTHYFIPLMTFPLLASLLAQNPNLAKAAQIMGAGSFRIFLRVTVPLSMPGVIAGCLLTYVLALGFFITPALLGGPRDMMVANLVNIYMRETLNWTLSAAISVVLLALSVMLLLILSRVPGSRTLLGEGR